MRSAARLRPSHGALAAIVLGLGACAARAGGPSALPLPPCAEGLERDAHGQCVGWLAAPALGQPRPGVALIGDTRGVWAVGGSPRAGATDSRVEHLALGATAWVERATWASSQVVTAGSMIGSERALLSTPGGAGVLELATGRWLPFAEARVALRLAEARTFIWGSAGPEVLDGQARAPAGTVRALAAVGATQAGGRVVVVGVERGEHVVTSAAPGAWRWTEPAPLFTGGGVVATIAARELIVILARRDADARLALMVIDPGDGRLQRSTTLGVASEGAVTAPLRDGRVAVFGRAAAGAGLIVLFVDPATGASEAGPAPRTLSGFVAASAMPDGRILVTDGERTEILVI